MKTISVLTATLLILGGVSCGKAKKGPKGDRGNKTIVYEVEGQKGDRGEKGQDGKDGIQGVAGPQGEKGADGETCQVTQNQDGATIVCRNSVAKIQNGVGCFAAENSDGVEVTCANGTTFIKNGAAGPVGPVGPVGPAGPPGRDGQLVVVPQPRYAKSCYTAIDSCDSCGNTTRYHIFYKVNTMPNGDVLSQICEGYNVNATNCTDGSLTQARLVIGDPRYPVAPVASRYTTAHLIDTLRAEINFRGNVTQVTCQGN